MEISFTSYKNTKRADKPNEDFLLCDSDRFIFILLDGVSRDAQNGIYPNPSPSEEVTTIIGNAIYREILDAWGNFISVSDMINNAIIQANRLAANYNSKNKLSFYAGTVGIVSVIKDCILYYSYIGDCSGRVIRDKNVHIFTESQTALIAQHKEEFSAYEIRNIICNNPEHPYSYGVLNGDERAKFFLRSGEISLYKNDYVIFSSDGLESFLCHTSVEELCKFNAFQLLNLAVKNNNINQDDRTIVKVSI